MSLIVPKTHHYAGSVTYRGGPKRCDVLKSRFEKYNLMERARESVFSNFFNAEEFKFSGLIIHALLLHKVHLSRDVEIQILIGETVCRFGRQEFGLISGLKFEADYTEEFIEFTNGRRLIITYFDGAESVRFHSLCAAFKMCRDREDVWLLGLVYFVEGTLLGVDETNYISMKLTSLVEVPDNFFRYHFGDNVFRATLYDLEKDMILHFQKASEVSSGDEEDANHETQRKGKQKGRSDKCKKGIGYILHRWIPCLQYWAFEIVPRLGSLATYKGDKFPRMMSWTINNAPKAKRIDKVFKLPKLEVMEALDPRPVEIEYLCQNNLLDRHVVHPAPSAAPHALSVLPHARDVPSCLSCHLLASKVESLKDTIQSLNEKFDFVYRVMKVGAHPFSERHDPSVSTFGDSPKTAAYCGPLFEDCNKSLPEKQKILLGGEEVKTCLPVTRTLDFMGIDEQQQPHHTLSPESDVVANISGYLVNRNVSSGQHQQSQQHSDDAVDTLAKHVGSFMSILCALASGCLTHMDACSYAMAPGAMVVHHMDKQHPV